MFVLILGLVAAVCAVPAIDKDSAYKDQYCTDPRTMRKHAAYTEWADAYSCTRHRCQPGGRNLAIYTVGCKRVEAPESAIECEEVVEDTNMQFPFCCTRLRCLVVVRGEVWTRVLGQPWEVLPAAPWSHMYKMKKPPPSDSSFLPKTSEQGPIYELSEPEGDSRRDNDKRMRAANKSGGNNADCNNDVVPRAAPPDIVIALSTNNELKDIKKGDLFNSRRSAYKKPEKSRRKRARKTTTVAPNYEEDREKKRERDREREDELLRERERERHIEPEIQEVDDMPLSTEKSTHHQMAWTEIPSNQWNEHEGMDVERENRVMVLSGQRSHALRPLLLLLSRDLQKLKEPAAYQAAPDFQAESPESKAPATKEEKGSNLQALVDAIGTRMRDIENVVQRMSEKVHQAKPGESGEKKTTSDGEEVRRHYNNEGKRPSSDGEHYKRFTGRTRGSKYLRGSDTTTDVPLFIEDSNGNGYFSDASNTLLRRAPGTPPKEPPPTYMAPVESHRRTPGHPATVLEASDSDLDKKHKKKHKKRKSKSHSHKKHRKDDKRKHFNRLISAEIDKNVVSLEDSNELLSN